MNQTVEHGITHSSADHVDMSWIICFIFSNEFPTRVGVRAAGPLNLDILTDLGLIKVVGNQSVLISSDQHFE